MERFVTYIIVILTVGCVFFILSTQEKRTDHIFPQATTIISDTRIPESRIDMDDRIPLDAMHGRIILKPFGMLVTPQNSPVSPERFSGYHAGIDVEIFDDETEQDVFVRAVCDGKIVAKDTINGYGGVIVQRCIINNEYVHVIYGHVRLSSVKQNEDATVNRGEELGILGTGFSVETDNERKHLHLGMYKGEMYSVRGYVQREQDLTQWMDPCTIINCGK